MTKRYRENQPAQLPICETFEATAIISLLAETGCSFLRIYYGMDENNQVHAILVGAGKDDKDLLPEIETDINSDPQILEDGYRCPPRCPPPSKLNS